MLDSLHWGMDERESHLIIIRQINLLTVIFHCFKEIKLSCSHHKYLRTWTQLISILQICTPKLHRYVGDLSDFLKIRYRLFHFHKTLSWPELISIVLMKRILIYKTNITVHALFKKIVMLHNKTVRKSTHTDVLIGYNGLLPNESIMFAKASYQTSAYWPGTIRPDCGVVVTFVRLSINDVVNFDDPTRAMY